MHYKKMHLLGDGLPKKESNPEPEKEPDNMSASGINFNHSVTDQIAKLSSVKIEKRPWEDMAAAASLSSMSTSEPNTAGACPLAVMDTKPAVGSGSQERKQGSSGCSKPVAYSLSENSRNSASEPGYSRGTEQTRTLEDRKCGSTSSSSCSSANSSYRADELKHPPAEYKHSQSSSPLVFDKYRPVEPYRDPELIKKDSEMRRIQMLQQAHLQQRGHAPTAVPATTSYPSVHTPIPGHHSTALQQHALLNPLAVGATYSHPALNQLSPHLPLTHALTSSSSLHGLSALVQQQQHAAQLQHLQLLQQQQQQQQQQQSTPRLLSQYAIHSNLQQTQQLEMLWQQKYPTMQVPPAWMLHQYQDDLLRDVNLMQQRDLVLERERREMVIEREIERERAERERQDKEREALQERQERERQERERKEREERERQEQERVERERQERERAELERAEKERLEKERQEQQRRLDTDRILLESRAAADAVNHHFQESLRIASQKGSDVKRVKPKKRPSSGGSSVCSSNKKPKTEPSEAPTKPTCSSTSSSTSSTASSTTPSSSTTTSSSSSSSSSTSSSATTTTSSSSSIASSSTTSITTTTTSSTTTVASSSTSSNSTSKKSRSKKSKSKSNSDKEQLPIQPEFISDCEYKLAKKKEKKEKVNSTARDNPSTILTNKPLNKDPIGKLRKSLEPFLQAGSCTEVTPKLMKCRECKMTPNQRNQKLPNIFCRFYAFRRLQYNAKGTLTISGFSEPADADADDIELWFPQTPVTEPTLDLEMAKYVIANVGDRFCELVEQEKKALAWVSPDTKIAWKRAVQGVREMCDACDTTLFNMHWVCRKCGFVVCIDCYRLRTRKGGACRDTKCTTCEKGGQKWLTCSSNRAPHEPEKLMITQIIPSDVLTVLGDLIHKCRDDFRIKSNCVCDQFKSEHMVPKNGMSQQLVSAVNQGMSPAKHKPLVNGVGDNHLNKGVNKKLLSAFADNVNGGAMSPLSLLAEAAVSRESEGMEIAEKVSSGKCKKNAKNSNSNSNGGAEQDKNSSSCSTLRDLLTRSGGCGGKAGPDNHKKSVIMHSTLDDIIQRVVENSHGDRPKKVVQLSHYIPKNGTPMCGRDSPIPQYTLTETTLLYPDVPHSWLDSGKLLRLIEPRNKGNIKLFQQQWKRAQPVLVSNCDRFLNMSLWHPKNFAKEFGHIENELINCHNNVLLIGHKMKAFWEGFERLSDRLTDDKGRPMIMKLKDWPATEDFADLMPERFRDLMEGLPLPEYTHRSGIFNLASRLPEFFVKPDLGPKLYNAYGSSLFPQTGSTNLHLDVSDAANIMLYVAIPEDDKDKQEEAAALACMDEAGCCEVTKDRVKEAGEKPGALWHIYDPQDSDKIRDLLNKVAKEKGEKIEPHHDPIHDQSWYLDEELRERLLKEYGVDGYTIVQCLGDAVFIPAGAPHQVRNLHSCIKAAEDFVSPENMNYCFRMTQEFRHLSDTHSNHEDKLQVKNIIYHAVKDAVAVLKDNQP